MLISALCHFVDKGFMPQVKSFQLSLPAKCFGMVSICLFAIDDYGPESMQFSVFPQKMLPAHILRRYVPDSHKINLSLFTKGFREENKFLNMKLS